MARNDELIEAPGAGWNARRQWRLLGALAVLIAVVIVAGTLLGRGLGRHDSHEAASAPPPGTFRPTPQQLKTLTIEPVTVHQFVSQEITEGKIAVNGDRSTPVFSPYSGRITRVIAGLGDSVKAGQPLATIEASEFAQAQSDLATALAQLKLARTSETRRHALYDAKGGSMADWLQSQADLSAAEASVRSVRNRLRILGYSEQAIDGLGSDEHTGAVAQIVAPISGVIVDRQLGPGQYAQAGGSTPVFTIADMSSVWMVGNVREADAGHVKRGQTVEVGVLAYPDRTFTARVIYVAPTIDPNTHRLTVRAVIDNADGALKPEMFASFRILTSEGAEAPAVPASAVVYEGDSAHVWVLQSADAIAIRPIRAGRASDGFVEVLDGLKPGERVVTRGSLFIDRSAAG
ncbi:MAG TPA: efflux RND transporter periplasmic adaptor subunit [Steroidobacteraceae bacterium]|jgi:cobalt-zinc-cadmium efflux system membrane fusion protein|nr:efflux RND transporter periplasmic adaptor subunit [Steroidobacteraceae bacterium]